MNLSACLGFTGGIFYQALGSKVFNFFFLAIYSNFLIYRLICCDEPNAETTYQSQDRQEQFGFRSDHSTIHQQKGDIQLFLITEVLVLSS